MYGIMYVRETRLPTGRNRYFRKKLARGVKTSIRVRRTHQKRANTFRKTSIISHSVLLLFDRDVVKVRHFFSTIHIGRRKDTHKNSFIVKITLFVRIKIAFVSAQEWAKMVRRTFCKRFYKKLRTWRTKCAYSRLKWEIWDREQRSPKVSVLDNIFYFFHDYNTVQPRLPTLG